MKHLETPNIGNEMSNKCILHLGQDITIITQKTKREAYQTIIAYRYIEKQVIIQL